VDYNKTTIDRSLAFTALLEQDWYKTRAAKQVTGRFLHDAAQTGRPTRPAST
jgi:hypothetical protein